MNNTLERLKNLASVFTWRAVEKWLTVLYLTLQLMMLFISPTASMAMGVFLIAVLIAATNF